MPLVSHPEITVAEHIFIDFRDTAVAIDPKGARYIAQGFDHPDGTKGMVIVMKLTKKEWKPDINNVTIQYNEN